MLIELVLEESLKWEVLRDILKEIKKENKNFGIEEEFGIVFIVVEDDWICS